MEENWLLRYLRYELSLTQQDLGNLCGLRQIRISQLERGVDTATNEERERIVQALLKSAAGRALEILWRERN